MQAAWATRKSKKFPEVFQSSRGNHSDSGSDLPLGDHAMNDMVICNLLREKSPPGVKILLGIPLLFFVPFGLPGLPGGQKHLWHHVTAWPPSGAWAKESHLRSRRATASFNSATWRSVEMGNMWCGKSIPINLPFPAIWGWYVRPIYGESGDASILTLPHQSGRKCIWSVQCMFLDRWRTRFTFTTQPSSPANHGERRDNSVMQRNDPKIHHWSSHLSLFLLYLPLFVLDLFVLPSLQDTIGKLQPEIKTTPLRSCCRTLP